MIECLASGAVPQLVDGCESLLSTVAETAGRFTSQRLLANADPFATTWTSTTPAAPPAWLVLAAEAFPMGMGRYRVQRMLGEGQMGSVYLAHDTKLQRDVALKIPKSAQIGDATTRFEREACVMARLHHPHVCSVYDAGDIDGTPYLSMSYVTGQTLADRLAAGPPRRPQESVVVVRQLAGALQAVHDAGVVHRDIKPANIMINNDGQPIIMDFGLAHTSDAGPFAATAGPLGTPAYMSPELVAAADRPARPASDIYSLGVVLYELLAGRLPFEGGIQAVLQQVVAAEPPPPSQFNPDVDRQLEVVCLRAMAKRIDQRYASAAELAAGLLAAENPVT